ncbi:DedA family protein [Bacillus haimaensis]|uniref:DedA family protein n=1 Tax=Bacillus haimaensis TaxID=3160967 RepID=UPI003AA8AA4B
MENWLTDIINQFGYMGIMFLIALENIFPPIPSEVILTFGGFATTTSNLSIGGVIAASTVGSVGGAIVLYVIGLQVDVERLEKIVERWGHILRITRKDIHRADAWFDRYGPWTVFLCRFVPLIRSLISIPAGMSNMNFGLFLLFTTLGTLIWNVVLINLGASVGSSWDTIVEYMDLYSKFVYFLLIVLFIALVVVYVRKRRMRK